MAKFQVDVPEGFDEEAPERPEFAFRGADPVGVGEEGSTPRQETPREKSLGTVISILMQSHEQIQNADTQLFTLTDFVARLKTGEISIEPNKGAGKKMVDAMRKNLIHSIVALDQALLVLDLEERGILGNHDGREFARLGLSIIDRVREERERWGLSLDDVPEIPAEAVELMKQAVAEMEAEQEAARGA